MDAVSSDTAEYAGGAQNAEGTGDLAGPLSELARTFQNEDDFEAMLTAMLTAMVHATPEQILGAMDAAIPVAILHPAAAEAKATSMLAFQSYTNGEDLGALNVYGADYEAFGQEPEETGLLVAAHAAVAFVDAQQNRHLHEALATGDLIGQAKDILMERFKITAQQASVVLTAASYTSNIKPRGVAEQLVTTGTFPNTKRW